MTGDAAGSLGRKDARMVEDGKDAAAASDVKGWVAEGAEKRNLGTDEAMQAVHGRALATREAQKEAAAAGATPRA